MVCKETDELLRIDPEELKELIQEYIDEEASDEHLDIAKASQKELKQIQVVLKE